MLEGLEMLTIIQNMPTQNSVVYHPISKLANSKEHG